MVDPQQESDRLFDDLCKRSITRPEYVNRIDELYGHIPPGLKSQVDRRRDGRSLGHFALAIYDTTVREKFLLREWASLLRSYELKFEDHGIGNDGRLLLDTRGQAGRPDYLLTSPRVARQLEVKFGPTQKFVTYKVADLKNYVTRKGLVILTIVGETKMLGPNGDPNSKLGLAIPDGLRWFLLRPKAIARILDEGEHGHHFGFGGKPTVRIKAREFAKFFTLHEWKPIERKEKCLQS